MDALRSLTTPHYEIYAPGDADLQRGSNAAEHALREWTRYFDGAAPKLAVVLYESEEQRRRYDEDKFRERGFALLRWPAYLPPTPWVWQEAGALLVGNGLASDARPRIAAVHAGGVADAVGLRSGDVVDRVNGTPVRSLATLRRTLAGIAEGSQIALEVERGGVTHGTTLSLGPASASSPFSPDEIRAALTTGPRVPTSAQIIAHEVAHALITHRFRPDSVPSWFHEGFASLVEEPEARKGSRWMQLRSLLGQRPSMAELIAKPHPATSMTRMSGGGSVGAMTPQNSAPQLWQVLYYPQSRALLAFLREREGERFIGVLAEGLARGDQLPDLLRRHARAVPWDLEALDREWAAWAAQ